MKTGIELIAAERQRQLSVHGFDGERDAQYTHNQLVSAAVHYALPGTAHGGRFWPSTWAARWNQKGADDRIAQLAKAGALLAAEIDRLQRATPPTET